MRVGCYELQVVGETGVPLRERNIGENNYVEAVAGQEYKVKAFLHRSDGEGFPMKYAIVCLSIDGSLVNYHMRVSADDNVDNGWLSYLLGFGSKSTVFTGFREGYNTYKAFVFTQLDGTGSGANQTGHLKVEFYEATVTPGLHNTPPGYNYKSLPVQSPKAAPENKKPAERPTLGTTSGRFISCGRAALGPDQPLHVWKKVRNVPDATLEVKCHTADALNFIQMVHDTRIDRIATNKALTDLTLTAATEQENNDAVKGERTSSSADTSSAADPATHAIDLTKMDYSALDLTVETTAKDSARPDVEYLGGSITTGAPAKTPTSTAKTRRKRKLRGKAAAEKKPKVDLSVADVEVGK